MNRESRRKGLGRKRKARAESGSEEDIDKETVAAEESQESADKKFTDTGEAEEAAEAEKATDPQAAGRSKPRRRILLVGVGVVVAAIAGTLFVLFSEGESTDFASLQKIEGLVRHAGPDNIFLGSANGDSLDVGSLLRVGEKGRAVVELPDGAKLFFAGASEARFSDVEFDAVSVPVDVGFSSRQVGLSNGMMYHKAERKTEHASVGLAVAGALLVAEDAATLVRCTRGTCVVTVAEGNPLLLSDAGPPLILVPGEQVTIGTNGAVRLTRTAPEKLFEELSFLPASEAKKKKDEFAFLPSPNLGSARVEGAWRFSTEVIESHNSGVIPGATSDFVFGLAPVCFRGACVMEADVKRNVTQSATDTQTGLRTVIRTSDAAFDDGKYSLAVFSSVHCLNPLLEVVKADVGEARLAFIFRVSEARLTQEGFVAMTLEGRGTGVLLRHKGERCRGDLGDWEFLLDGAPAPDIAVAPGKPQKVDEEEAEPGVVREDGAGAQQKKEGKPAGGKTGASTAKDA